MTVLVVNTAATWAMVGLIWTMQLVHYPMLSTISSLAPATAAADHQRRITWLVGPLMLAEGVTTLWLLVDRPDTMPGWSAWVAAAWLAVALGSTALIQVPLHARLAQRHDPDAAERLLTSNWIRTVAWSMRGLLLAWVLAT